MKTLAVMLALGCAHTPPVHPPCAPATIEMHYFDGPIGVEKRVIDRHRCGVVELRVIDHYDVAADTRTREVFHDRDHDGRFERYWTRVEELRGANEALATGRPSGTAQAVVPSAGVLGQRP